jgi:DNA-binding winged helix-turn-helix (wHTH) protein/tetratricopeptide (TPR) repeat protein
MSILRFGVFEVDSDSGELRKRGFRLRLREQPFRLLLTLIDHAGRVITREQLRHRLWPADTFVDFDRAINKAVSELRGALGDSASSPRFIETLSKRGYRFVCPVDGSPRPLWASTSDGFPSDAQRACLTGRYLWDRRTVTDLHSSIGFFEHALELDEGCALAHAGLADANVLLGIWGLRPPDVAFGAGRRAAARALELDPNLAEAHTAMAEVLKGYEWDWWQAERHYQRALVLRPDYATAHQWYAQLLVSQRRYPEAASHIELARRANPVSPVINSFLPYIYLAARDYGRAVREAHRAVNLEPYAPLAYWYLGRAYLCSNQAERAVEALEHVISLGGAASIWVAPLSYARARAGDHAGAMALLSELTERARHEYVSPYDLAIAFTGIGDHESALDHLEQAFGERVMRIVMLGDPEFDGLRAEPRYRRLVDRLRLPSGPM